MKPNTKIVLTGLKQTPQEIETETGYRGICNGLKGKLVTGKQDDPECNPDYYEVMLDSGKETLCLHREEFTLASWLFKNKNRLGTQS